MNSHVAETRNTMFRDSAEEVRRQLNSLVKDVENTLGDKADEVFIQIKRDYRSVLGGGDTPSDSQVLPRVQRQVRKEVAHIIDGVEEMMRKVVGLELDEDADTGEGNEKSHIQSNEAGDNSRSSTQQPDNEKAREASAYRSASSERREKVAGVIRRETGSLSPAGHGTEPAGKRGGDSKVEALEANTSWADEESKDEELNKEGSNEEELEDDSSSASA